MFQNLDVKLLANEEVLNTAVNAKATYNNAPSIMEFIVLTIPEIYENREYIKKVLMKYPKLMEFLSENIKNDKVCSEYKGFGIEFCQNSILQALGQQAASRRGFFHGRNSIPDNLEHV